MAAVKFVRLLRVPQENEIIVSVKNEIHLACQSRSHPPRKYVLMASLGIHSHQSNYDTDCCDKCTLLKMTAS